MQGSVRALKAAPKLHNYISTRNKNSDTQKYTHTKKTAEYGWPNNGLCVPLAFHRRRVYHTVE